jgi:formate/nitrite transporter FocA (FNT family)
LKVRIDLAAAVFSFFLPTLLGNVTGGTVLFALIAYAQVRDEIDESK